MAAAYGKRQAGEESNAPLGYPENVQSPGHPAVGRGDGQVATLAPHPPLQLAPPRQRHHKRNNDQGFGSLWSPGKDAVGPNFSRSKALVVGGGRSTPTDTAGNEKDVQRRNRNPTQRGDKEGGSGLEVSNASMENSDDACPHGGI